MHKRTLGSLAIMGVIAIAGVTPAVQATDASQSKLIQKLARAANPNLSTYQNAAFKLSIQYPRTWRKQEQITGLLVMFLSPKESNADKFQENLNILVRPLARPATLAEATKLGTQQMKEMLSDFKLISSKNTTLGNSPANQIVFTGKQGKFNLKWMQTYTIKNKKIYVLTYTAEVGKYSTFLGTIQKTINSFRLN